MLKFSLFSLFGLLALLATALTARAARQRARLQEARGGCVACGSAEIEARGELRTCRRCGYAGRADGGGKLGEDDLRALQHETNPLD